MIYPFHIFFEKSHMLIDWIGAPEARFVYLRLVFKSKQLEEQTQYIVEKQ